MRQGAGGDDVYARFRIRPDVFERYIAAHLEYNAAALAPATAARIPSRFMLSSMTTSAPASRACSSSSRPVTSTSILCRWCVLRRGALDGRAYATRAHDVVFLDEHAVEQVMAMI